MRKVTFRVMPGYNDAPRGAIKKRIFFLFAIFISTVAILIPDISFAISMDDPKLVARETAQIKKFREKVKRDGDTLLLKNKSGTFISLKDNLKCEGPDACAGFKFLDYFEDVGFFLVQGYYWESGQHIMVSEYDERKYYVHELPMFSPDRRRIVTTPNFLDSGYGRTGVFVWRFESGKLIQEFSYEPTGYDYILHKSIKWKDNSHIELIKFFRPTERYCPETDFITVSVDLKKEADGWKLYKDFSPDSIKCDAKW